MDTDSDSDRRVKDSCTPPDEAARGKTRTFLGPDLARARIQLVRHTTYGLGGVTLELRGNGRAQIVKQPWGTAEKPQRLELRLEPAASQEVLAAFVDQAFTEIFLGQAVGVPDELFFELLLENAGGEIHRLGKFVRTEHARFDALVSLVHRTVAGALDPATRKRLTL